LEHFVLMSGLFITFEGTEGSGKSTQVLLLAQRLRGIGYLVRQLREPGGTPIGEEIRQTLKHSQQNHAMTAEAELLMMNASRAQLVREVIRPALALQEIVLCDRFHDSTVAYQGYGRGLDLQMVQTVIDFAIGETSPQLTFLLMISPTASEARRRGRALEIAGQRDRFEEADRGFFERVEKGYRSIAIAARERVKLIDGAQSIAAVSAEIWRQVEPVLTVKASR
jgi:dTMP kinase